VLWRIFGRGRKEEWEGQRMCTINRLIIFLFVNVSGYENILARRIARTGQVINW
jgi:hypothetical protein